MNKLVVALVAVAALALGTLVGVAIGHSTTSRASTVTIAGGVTTVRARAASSPTRTVTHVVVHTHTVTAPTPTPTEPTSTTASTDCNDLPASASTNLAEIRESRCEMEKLNGENPSTADEHEIESMISSERAIEASE